MDKWREVFVEGHCYRLETFILEPNEGDYKAADNNYKIVFNRTTTAKPVQEPKIDLHAFKFTSFQEILTNPKPEAFLIGKNSFLYNSQNYFIIFASFQVTKYTFNDLPSMTITF